MSVESEKIKKLIEYYGKLKGYPESSYVSRFAEDFKLNYNQWSAYTRGAQVIGLKIIHKLMEIFPDLNMNWYMKDDYNMFITENFNKVEEVDPKYSKEIVDALYKRADEMGKKLSEIHKLSKL